MSRIVIFARYFVELNWSGLQIAYQRSMEMQVSVSTDTLTEMLWFGFDLLWLVCFSFSPCFSWRKSIGFDWIGQNWGADLGAKVCETKTSPECSEAR